MVKTITGSDVDINTDGKKLISYAVIFIDDRHQSYNNIEPRPNSYIPFSNSDEKKIKTNQRDLSIYDSEKDDYYNSYYFIVKGDENDTIKNSYKIACVIWAPDIDIADKILKKAASKKVITWQNMALSSGWKSYGYGGSTRKKRAKKSYKKSRRTGSKSSKARRSFK